MLFYAFYLDRGVAGAPNQTESICSPLLSIGPRHKSEILHLQAHLPF